MDKVPKALYADVKYKRISEAVLSNVEPLLLLETPITSRIPVRSFVWEIKQQVVSIREMPW